jgi:hypothetical protein
MASAQPTNSRRAAYRSEPLRSAAIGSTVVAVGFFALLLVAPVAAPPAIGGYVAAVLGLWWFTGGERPWYWPYASRTPQNALARLARSSLQLNRSVVLFGVGTATILALLLLAATLLTLLVIAFDFLGDGMVHLGSYEDFFTHDVPRWITQAADGRAGSTTLP